MKGSLNKGLLTYVFIFVGLLISVVLILACILLFSPGTEIFGITYINKNNVYEIKTLDGDDGTILVDSEGNKVEYKQEASVLNLQDILKTARQKYRANANTQSHYLQSADCVYIPPPAQDLRQWILL